MPSVVKEYFTAAKSLTPKEACIAFVYKLFNGSKGTPGVSSSQYNKIYLSTEYRNFLKKQNIVFAYIGKPNTEKYLSLKRK